MRAPSIRRTAVALMALLATATAVTSQTSSAEARPSGTVIRFQQGVLCDEAGQIAEILSQFGQGTLQGVLETVNKRTGKVSCGVVKKPIVWLMEPLSIVSTPGGKMAIVRLTSRTGIVQYAWRKLENFASEGNMA